MCQHVEKAKTKHEQTSHFSGVHRGKCQQNIHGICGAKYYQNAIEGKLHSKFSPCEKKKKKVYWF